MTEQHDATPPPVPAAKPSAPPPSTPPPGIGRVTRIVLSLLVAVAMLIVGTLWGSQIGQAAKGVFHARSGGGAPATQPSVKQYWTCGMHPWVVQQAPGDCPICQMKLVPLDPKQFKSEIAIDPVITQNIGVRTATAASGPVTRVIRTVGSVEYDEKALRDVNLKIGGWIEKLYVDYVGQAVEKGQPLLEIYSPELYTAQEEYVQAYKNRSHAATAPAAAQGGKWESDLLDSARKRLEFYDVAPDQIQALEQAGKPAKTMTLKAPFGGTVVVRNAFEGAKVDSGTQLFRIADLSRVWVMVTLYEYQLPFIQVGQNAAMSLTYLPGQHFDGKIAYIYPVITPETRQVKIRLEFDNAGGYLKPGMFANVEIRSTLVENHVLVPREALIDTGQRKVVFVSLGQGRFDPRNVTVGVDAEGGMVEILDGIRPGEAVVTSGQFLLDSESNRHEFLAKFIRGTMVGEQPAAGAATAGEPELKALPEAAAKALSTLLNEYFQIGGKLADDSTDGLADPARKIAAQVDALVAAEIPAQPHFWHQHTEAADIRGKAMELVSAEDLPAARENFADLSIALGKLLHATGVPPAYGKTVEELHCPMYREGQGGNTWLEADGLVRNPYFDAGKGMRGCFDVRTPLPVTGSTAASAQTQPATKPNS